MAKVSNAKTRRKLLDRDRYIPGHLLKLANGMSRSASRAYLSVFGIGVVEWRILSIVCIESYVTAQNICTAIEMDRAAASRSLRVLEGKGLVKVADDLLDYRKRPITITKSGKELHDTMLAIVVRRQNILTNDMSPSEIDTLLGLLIKLESNLDAVFAHDAKLIAMGNKGRRTRRAEGARAGQSAAAAE
jgi:DNA-binding MarR family transcriptional regulator